MKKVPDFLLFRLSVTCPVHTRSLPQQTMVNTEQNWMELRVFQSPDMVHGLLMTEVLSPSGESQRFFFGYKCVACETCVLVPSNVRETWALDQAIRHTCDVDVLRRAVRNARYIALEKGEQVMEEHGGRWSVAKFPQDFEQKYINNQFSNDAVFSSEQVSKMYDHGIITNAQADAMLRIRYEGRYERDRRNWERSNVY